MSRRILLARHGSHDEVGRVLSGRSAIGLNDEGRAEAQALAGWAAEQHVDALRSSPRPRALQTAEAVAERLSLPVREDGAVDEIDFGAFSGRRFDALASDPAWRRWNAARATTRCPGGETMAEAVARSRAALAAVAGGTTLVVSHCDVIRGVVADLLGLDTDAIFRFGCDPGSVTILEEEGGWWRLAALNLQPC